MGRGTNAESSRGKVAAAVKQEAMEPADAGAVMGSPEPGDPSPPVPPEALAKLAEIRARVETSVGQIVLMLMNVPRYRHQSIADLQHLVIEPLLRDRIAIAYGKPRESNALANPAPAGIAIWASVDAATDAKIQEQVKAGVFPVRLGDEDWASGETLWLLEVLAPNQKAATAVLLNFSSIAGDGLVHIHPIVARSVDPTIIKRLKRA